MHTKIKLHEDNSHMNNHWQMEQYM